LVTYVYVRSLREIRALRDLLASKPSNFASNKLVVKLTGREWSTALQGVTARLPVVSVATCHRALRDLLASKPSNFASNKLIVKPTGREWSTALQGVMARLPVVSVATCHRAFLVLLVSAPFNTG